MSRTVVSTMSTALQAQGQEIVWFIELEFSSGTLRLCTAQHDMSWGAAGSGVLATDSFTEASDTNADAHSPDTGSFSWEQNGSSGDAYVEAAVDQMRFTQNSGTWLRSSIDLIPDSYKCYSQCKVIRNGVDGTFEQAGLYGYAETTNPVVGEGFALNVIRSSGGATTGDIKFYETNSSGTNIQTVTLASGVDWDVNGSLYLKYETDGLTITPYWKKNVGDAWTTLSAQTMTQNVLDGNHNAAGVFGNDGSQATSSEPYVDDWEFGLTENIWTGIGGHLTLDAVEESSDRQAGVNLTLDGVDTTVIALVLGANYLGRQAKIYYGLIGSDGAIVADPIQFGPYYMLSSWNVRETRSPNGQGTASVRGRLTSRLAPLTKVKGIVTNVRSHEKHYSGDLFFEFIPALVGKRIIWGGQSSGLGGGGNRGGGGIGNPKDEGDVAF